MLRRKWAGMLVFAAITVAGTATGWAQDIVLYSSDVSNAQGNWYASATSTGAGGQRMTGDDYGWSSTDAPSAAPGDYFEATFSAPSFTTYHVWLRMRATGDSKWNDSVWVQFSDSADRFIILNGADVIAIAASHYPMPDQRLVAAVDRALAAHAADS